MTLTFDGWKSAGGRKLLGILATLVAKADGVVTHDLRGTTVITAVEETAALVRSRIETEVAAAAAAGDYNLPLATGQSDHSSTLGALVSDSASPNVGAKSGMCAVHRSLLDEACFAHQLNPLTGFIIATPRSN